MSAERIQEGSVIEIVYTIMNQDGVVLDRRDEGRPAQFVFGQGQVLPAIEKAILGQGAGFVKKVVVPESMAFGAHDPSLITTVHRSALPEKSPVKIGTRFKTEGPSGEKIVIRVIDVEGENVKLDGNHPLAGNDLHIDLRVVSVADPVKDEGGQDDEKVLH